MVGKNNIVISTEELEKCVREFAVAVQKLLLRHPQTVTFADKLEKRVLALDSPVSNIVIMGRQITGKSTLLNAIIGKDRAHTGHTETTTTLDTFQFGHINILDTPGTGSTKTQYDEVVNEFLEGDHEVTSQHGVIPHALIYVASDVTPHTVSKVGEDIDYYTQSLGILPEYCILVVQKWDIADSPDEKAEEMCELLRESLQDQVSMILPTSGLLANACRDIDEDTWSVLSKLGTETSVENSKTLIDIDESDTTLSGGKDVDADVLELNSHVRKFSLLLARSQKIENGKDLRKAVLEKSGIETLRKKLSQFSEQKTGCKSSIPSLVRVLTVYRLLSNIHGEAVSVLEGILQDEEAHQNRGKELEGKLRNTTTPTTPLSSLEKSLESLQAALSYYTTIEEAVRKLRDDDLGKSEGLLENCMKVLVEARETVASFHHPDNPAETLRDVEERLAEIRKQEKQRVEESQKTWDKALSDLPRVIIGLQSVETYLTGSDHPSSIHDVCHNTQVYLDTMRSHTEARITQIKELLADLRETKAEIQLHVDLFEEDISCLTLLDTLENLEIADQDRTELLRLFGQHGTSQARRLRLPSKTRKTPKQYVQKRIEYWNYQSFDALDREQEQICNHAIVRLENIISNL